MIWDKYELLIGLMESSKITAKKEFGSTYPVFFIDYLLRTLN